MTDNDWREARLRAIAINSIREARVAYNRDAEAWIDDDSKRLDMIFRILHLAELPDVDPSAEHLGLAPKVQAKENPAFNAVAKALENLSEEPAPRLKLPQN